VTMIDLAIGLAGSRGTPIDSDPAEIAYRLLTNDRTDRLNTSLRLSDHHRRAGRRFTAKPSQI